MWFPDARPTDHGEPQMPPTKMKFSTLTLFAVSFLLLSACTTFPGRRLADFPEPHRSSIAHELRDHPDSPFSRAYRGETGGLHATFHRVLEPDLDGGASESFLYNIMAIRGALGDDRFFAALERETPDIQQRMQDYAPRSQ
jgi:hypothetical protein